MCAQCEYGCEHVMCMQRSGGNSLESVSFPPLYGLQRWNSGSQAWVSFLPIENYINFKLKKCLFLFRQTHKQYIASTSNTDCL